jgi:nitroimidazol reductase NimA-like FMN-containing flavoprotein (pyridoxamine 5'-phosphate oxidase superfamily)
MRAHDDAMISYPDLQTVAPEIAEPTAARLHKSGLGMLGTIRRDGSPRVSPIEVAFHEGHLYIGMMPGSTKFLDVERDPRIALVTAIADKDDQGGEGKLFGIAARVTDPARAERILRAAADASGFDPESVAGSPMYEVMVTGAAWQRVEGDAFVTTSWSEGGAVRHRRRDGATGAVVDA